MIVDMSETSDPVLEEVLAFENLPPGEMASRRALVLWSDGTQGEALRWCGDEVPVCVGDHGNSRVTYRRST